MSSLPANFLSKKGGQWRKVTLLQLAILLFHVHRGATDDQVGFEDAQETLDTLTRKLNRPVHSNPVLLESALWSANLLDEQGKWWHPHGLTFDEFVVQLLGRKVKFDKIYNLIEEEKA